MTHVPPRPQRSPEAGPCLLVVGDDAIATLCSSGSMMESWSVQAIATLAAALSRIADLPAGVIVTELQLPDGDGIELCTATKKLPGARLVLVTTDDVTRVPRALAAGCHSVLLKPFAPNLLFARLGRLMRGLQALAGRPGAAYDAGTNQYWPSVRCTRCGASGVTSFDPTSLRRAWYACLHCESVWVASQQH
jgi:DNA-binding response OmpR family regulator